MTTSLNNSLLSLLLALNRLEVPLTEDESTALVDIGEQLMYSPDTWEDIIEPDLMAILEGNPDLRSLYQEFLTDIQERNGNFPPNLLPTQAELGREIPNSIHEPTDFSHFIDLATEDNPELEPDVNSQEILNAAIQVLSTPNPVQTSKKISGIQRVWQFLQQRFF
ncbi:hypothetical protein [Phormidium sp. CCY1219]|uniref:hypothetical protein n=1 Tax=Phormidium sp. CCY1219 TaxID=2886104 RepID=UPI002D1F753D|nr:hypothetical protein [Phormidium sp. CCY1219]MEB3827582.1 hypothetical protein [Phormidium sp. CCY1219]